MKWTWGKAKSLNQNKLIRTLSLICIGAELGSFCSLLPFTFSLLVHVERFWFLVAKLLITNKYLQLYSAGKLRYFLKTFAIFYIYEYKRSLECIFKSKAMISLKVFAAKNNSVYSTIKFKVKNYLRNFISFSYIKRRWKGI